MGSSLFTRVLPLSRMQTTLSRIWTLNADSISYDNNHYPMWASKCVMVWFGYVLWNINPCGLFNAKSCLYICIIYIYIYIYIYSVSQKWVRGCPLGVMVKVMDCGIVVSKFVLQSRYYVHFRVNTIGKGMNPLILPAMG